MLSTWGTKELTDCLPEASYQPAEIHKDPATDGQTDRSAWTSSTLLLIINFNDIHASDPVMLWASDSTNLRFFLLQTSSFTF